jgi:hypothetical protein
MSDEEHVDDIEDVVEFDEFRFMPLPPPCSDAQWLAIMAQLPKNVDAHSVRRALRQSWSVYLEVFSKLGCLGARKPKSQRVAAHRAFVQAARAFIEVYTEQMYLDYQYITGNRTTPSKSKRVALVKEIGELADWHEERAKEIKAGESSDLAKDFLIHKLWGVFVDFGGGTKVLARNRFIGNASAPLGPDHALSEGAVRDAIRDKKPKAKKPKKGVGGKTSKE